MEDKTSKKTSRCCRSGVWVCDPGHWNQTNTQLNSPQRKGHFTGLHKTEPREGIRKEIISSSSSKGDQGQPPTSHTTNLKMTLLLETGRLMALNLKGSGEVAQIEVGLSQQQLPDLAMWPLRGSCPVSADPHLSVCSSQQGSAKGAVLWDRTSPCDSLTFGLIFRIAFIATGFT